MLNVEKVEYNGELLAIVLRHSLVEGVHFVTDKDNSFQMGIQGRKSGEVTRPHIHRNIVRTIKDTQEILHIEVGKVQVDFYSNQGEKIRSLILDAGDTILEISGGHGIKMLEDSIFLDVKQGYYTNVGEDKEYLC